MKLLLIGHGYLGGEIARRFRADGWEVTPVTLHGGDGTIACDVADAESVKRLGDEVTPDFIVHCAASGRGGAEAYQRVYVDGCRNLAATFPESRLLFTSSSSVYAQTDGSWVDETSPTIPERETGRLLREAEQITLAAGGTVARLAGIYGPGRSVILRKFLSGEAVIEDDGRRFLNQIHRDDAARAILMLAGSRAAGVFNVCDSIPLAQRDCYAALAETFGRPLPPTGPRDLNRKRGWTHKRVSNAKLRAAGWAPAFPSFLDAVPEIAPMIEDSAT